MRILTLLLIVGGLAAPGAAQDAPCVDAYETAVAVKERLFAGGQTPQQLRDFQRRVKSRLEECGDLRSLWDVRLQLAKELKDTVDQGVVEKRYPSAPQADPVRRGAFDPTSPIGKRWALLVGTNTFEFKRELNVKDLEYAEADLKLLADVATNRLGFSEVEVLAGARFTLDQWRAAIARLRVKVEENDLVVVYVLSHGKPTKADRNNTSFILTHASRGGETGIYTTSIQVIDMVQELSRELRAQRVIIVIDACFSGDAISGQKDYGGHPAPYLLEAFTRGSGRAVIAAARADQLSWELPAKKQGAFAYCFGKVTTASATLGETFAAVSRCVSAEVGPEHEQNPVLFASEGARAIKLGNQP